MHTETVTGSYTLGLSVLVGMLWGLMGRGWLFIITTNVHTRE